MTHERWTAEQYRAHVGAPTTAPRPSVVAQGTMPMTRMAHAMNKTEQHYAIYLDMAKSAGRIRRYWPQPFAFRLPGWSNTYRPDFLVQYPYAGPLEIVEIKAGWKDKNGTVKAGWKGDGRAKFKTAAGLYPCFSWVARWYDTSERTWKEERHD